MKVLFLIPNYPNKYNPVSGNFYKIICEHLVKNGVEVHVICPVPFIPFWLGLINKKFNQYRFFLKSEERNGVKIYRPRYIRLPFVGIKKRYIHANRQVLKLTTLIQPDIVDARKFYPAFPIGWFALNIKKVLGIPFIYTNNGVGKHLSLNEDPSIISFFTNLLKQASEVFAVTKEISDETLEIYHVQPKIIRHGIELSKYTSFITKKSYDEKDVLKVIYVGAISEFKGIDTLLSAIGLVNDANIHYTFIGENFMGGKISEIERYKNITYLGRLTHEETIIEIAKSNVLILPTKFEGMPNVIKEAGILNVPVISTNVGGIPEILNWGERGDIFEAGNAQELALKIESVKNNYLEAKNKSDKLKEHIISEYDIETNTLSLIKTYNKIYATKDN